MLRFVCGYTGGGKSQFAAGQLITELRSGNRCIITNLAVEMGPWVDGRGKARRGLKESLIQQYHEDFDCERRVRILRDDEVRYFFRHRRYLDPISNEVVEGYIADSGDRRFHFDGSRWRGVCYIIDEGHEYFPASAWKEIGDETQSWASQNRRCGDDAWVLTQDPELVAKPFRRQSKECFSLVNHGHLRAGMFRQLDTIKWALYQTTPPGKSDHSLATGSMEYGREFLRGVYNTAKGAGVKGSAADIGYRAKGMHLGWIVPIVIVAMLGIGVLFRGCIWGAGKAVNRLAGLGGGLAHSVGTNTVAGFVSPLPARATGSVAVVAPVAVPVATAAVASADADLLEVVGWGVVGGGVDAVAMVEMASGERIWGKELAVGRYVVLDGQRFERGKRVVPGPPKPAVAVKVAR